MPPGMMEVPSPSFEADIARLGSWDAWSLPAGTATQEIQRSEPSLCQ